MRDLAIIVDALERTVTTVFHHRIDYPGFDFNRERATPAAGAVVGGRRAEGGLMRVDVQARVGRSAAGRRASGSVLGRAARAARLRAARKSPCSSARTRGCAPSTGATAARTGRPTSSPFRPARRAAAFSATS